MIYFKFDFSQRKDRWLFLLVLGTTALVLTLLVSGAFQVTTAPVFCTLCHEMNPEYQTWKVSSHSSLSCSVCHLDRSIQGLINYEKQLLKRAEKHFSGKYFRPIAMPKPIPQERCLRCHVPHRKATPRGDIIIPHERHGALKITCSECHSGVAHGNIADRGLTEEKGYTAWTPAMARNEMGPRQTGISMQECMECHQSLDVKTSCEDCHGAIRKPDSHYSASFLADHGQRARKNLRECDLCHSYSKTFVSVEAVDEVAEYARENSFCTECHLKLPASHQGPWKNTHGKILGGMDNRGRCLVCHDENRLSKAFRATETSCNRCHGDAHSPVWRETHGGRVTKLEFSAECLRCHPAQKCGQCHYTKV